MALATHHLQGSYGTCLLRFSSGNSGNTLRHFVTRIGVPPLHKPKGKTLKISAFKNNSQNQFGGRAGGSKSLKNSEKLSHLPQESEETSVESSSTQNVPISHHTEANKTTNYHTIRDMLKSWLTLLHTPPLSNTIMGGALEETSFPEILEMQNLIQKKEKGEVLKTIWSHFQSLDATIKIPILALIPLYVAVNLAYGAEVCKELTPLWILGPCVVALYIKMLGSICALYVFSFKQAVNVVKSFTTYFVLAYNYIAHGRLKVGIRASLLQPMVDFRNSDYNKLAKRKNSQVSKEDKFHLGLRLLFRLKERDKNHRVLPSLFSLLFSFLFNHFWESIFCRS